MLGFRVSGYFQGMILLVSGWGLRVLRVAMRAQGV